MTAASATLRVCRLRPDVDGDVPLPRAMSAEAAGLDVCAALSGPLVLEPGERAAVPTGFALGVPPGWEVQIRPRSGLAIRHGITLINSPGTVDSDYRGEVMVLLVNHGRDRFTVQRGMRIAQLVVARLAPISVLEVDSLDATARGAAGFGSTGVDSADPAEA